MKRATRRGRMRTAWFFLKYSAVKPQARPAFREAARNQRLSRDELEALNWSRTQALLRYAYNHVPYYRDKWQALDLSPEDIKRPEDFARVPALTRRDVQENTDRLISDQARPKDLKASTTGGSTGEPLKVYHEKKVVRSAQLWRILDWWGLPPDVDMASIYRNLNPGRKKQMAYDLFWWPTRHVLLDARAIDEESVHRFVRQVVRLRPPVIHAYVGALAHVAQYIIDHKIAVPPPKVIWSTSSPLTAVQERRIEQAFGAPVCDHYGCCEVYWLAAECPAKSGLHVFHDVATVEIIDDLGRPVSPGKCGRIAITDLKNRMFPLIRYLNGDRGRTLISSCPCGMSLPLIDKVKGRTCAMLRSLDGTVVDGITTLFDHTPEAVRRFQVIQRQDYSVDILVVTNPGFPGVEGVLEGVRHTLSGWLHNTVPVRINIVPALPSQDGKLHFVRSELQD